MANFKVLKLHFGFKISLVISLGHIGIGTLACQKNPYLQACRKISCFVIRRLKVWNKGKKPGNLARKFWNFAGKKN